MLGIACTCSPLRIFTRNPNREFYFRNGINSTRIFLEILNGNVLGNISEREGSWSERVMSPKTKLTTSNLVHINAVLLIQRERTIGDLCHRKPRLTLSRNISYSPRVGSIVYPGNPEFPIATWRCTPLPMTSALSLGASISANQCSSIACIPVLCVCQPCTRLYMHVSVSEIQPVA